MKSVSSKNPVIIPMGSSESDCGYACASVILALHGLDMSVADVKSRGGTSARGLTVRQLRDVLTKLAGPSDVMLFDTHKAGACPTPSIVLLKYSHYAVATEGRKPGTLDIFYPERGWRTVPARQLAKVATGLAVTVRSIDSAHLKTEPSTRPPRMDPLAGLFWTQARSRLGFLVIAAASLSECFSLTVPLLSKDLVNSAAGLAAASFATRTAILFVVIAAVADVNNIVCSALGRTLERRLSVSASTVLFDRLATMPPQWFDAESGSTIYGRVHVLDELLGLFTNLLSSAVKTVFGAAVGIAALLYVSPWLTLPGLVAAMVSIGIAWHSNQRFEHASARILNAFQRHHSFVMDVIPQIPVLARVGALWSARARFRRLTRESTLSRLSLARISDQRAVFDSGAKLFEQAAFACIAAYFTKRFGLTLGAFVALGVYKDHFARSVVTAFKTWQRYTALRPARSQVRELLELAPANSLKPRSIRSGHVTVEDVTFRYGTLEAPVLENVSIEFPHGSFALLTGVSGGGKSTLVKTILGLCEPCAGRVTVDGGPPEVGMHGCAAVLQSDRLIFGTIGENVRMFRKNITDHDIVRALTLVELDAFVGGLPMKLDTIIGEGRGGLSGGQRQRVLLARAVVCPFSLLVLDEATASLDLESERRILSELRRSGATLVVCTHRREVWPMASALYVVANRHVRAASSGAQGRDECCEQAGC